MFTFLSLVLSRFSLIYEGARFISMIEDKKYLFNLASQGFLPTFITLLVVEFFLKKKKVFIYIMMFLFYIMTNIALFIFIWNIVSPEYIISFLVDVISIAMVSIAILSIYYISYIILSKFIKRYIRLKKLFLIALLFNAIDYTYSFFFKNIILKNRVYHIEKCGFCKYYQLEIKENGKFIFLSKKPIKGKLQYTIFLPNTVFFSFEDHKDTAYIYSHRRRIDFSNSKLMNNSDETFYFVP